MAFSVAFCAGESSGDLNGAALASELKKLAPDTYLWGAGGARMRASGVDVKVDMDGFGTIGVAETLRVLPEAVMKYRQMLKLLLTAKPDIFVPIDFGSFNSRLATRAHENGIKVVYYFPPSSWRKKLKSTSKLAGYTDHVITPFPWSEQLLRNGGIDARFVGHPLLDIVKPSVLREDFFCEMGLDSSRGLVGLLPGSRRHEIKAHLLPMLFAAEAIAKKTSVQFVVCLGGDAGFAKGIINDFLRRSSGVKIVSVDNRTYDAMSSSDIIISCSGTATLEAAILETPMVIVYNGSPLMHFEYLFRRGVVEKFIGMPNIIADELVCPEILGNDVTAENMADTACSILTDYAKYKKMKAGLVNVKTILGSSGAVERSAELLLEYGGIS